MRVWIINHYAIPPSLGGLNRHYYFSKYMQENGPSVKIFTSSQIHNSDVNLIGNGNLYSEQAVDGIKYTFVRTSPYKGNGVSRMKNMLEFSLNIWRVCKRFERPEIIYTSSPSLLAAASALFLAKTYKVPCVVEIRDFWPESLVEYAKWSPKSPVVLLLYKLEKWLYKSTDRIIFTMEGGSDYLFDKGLDTQIDMSKIYHVNNGVDLEGFDRYIKEYQFDDSELSDDGSFNVVYTGSIRAANNVMNIVKAAKLVRDTKGSHIKFILYGDGDELPDIKKYIEENKLDNVILKGFVGKKYIPYALSRANLNILNYMDTVLNKYGMSQNKLFEYFASGKPILCNIRPSYNLISRYKAGITLKDSSAESIAEAVIEFSSMSQGQYAEYCGNARRAALDYDYKVLSGKIESVLSETIAE